MFFALCWNMETLSEKMVTHDGDRLFWSLVLILGSAESQQGAVMPKPFQNYHTLTHH
jgi:hypothetical protein